MIFLIILICVLIALLFGKREPVDLVLPDISIETSVDQYLEMQESNVAGVQPWARKEVIWANKKEEKTKYYYTHILYHHIKDNKTKNKNITIIIIYTYIMYLHKM